MHHRKLCPHQPADDASSTPRRSPLHRRKTGSDPHRHTHPVASPPLFGKYGPAFGHHKTLGERIAVVTGHRRKSSIIDAASTINSPAPRGTPRVVSCDEPRSSERRERRMRGRSVFVTWFARDVRAPLRRHDACFT